MNDLERVNLVKRHLVGAHLLANMEALLSKSKICQELYSVLSNGS